MSYIKHNEKGNFYTSENLKQDFEISTFLTPVSRVQFFYNREEEIQKVKEYLFEEKNQFLSITGLAGIGKTSLIKKCIADFKDNLSHIVWLRHYETNGQQGIFHNETLIANLFLDIQEIQIQDSSQIIKRMNDLKGRNLLVIDDFDSQIREDFKALKQLNENWKIILISRFRIGEIDELKLENLKKEDYKTILRQRLGSVELDNREFDNLINKANRSRLRVYCYITKRQKSLFLMNEVS